MREDVALPRVMVMEMEREKDGGREGGMNRGGDGWVDGGSEGDLMELAAFAGTWDLG